MPTQPARNIEKWNKVTHHTLTIQPDRLMEEILHYMDLWCKKMLPNKTCESIVGQTTDETEVVFLLSSEWSVSHLSNGRGKHLRTRSMLGLGSSINRHPRRIPHDSLCAWTFGIEQWPYQNISARKFNKHLHCQDRSQNQSFFAKPRLVIPSQVAPAFAWSSCCLSEISSAGKILENKQMTKDK